MPIRKIGFRFYRSIGEDPVELDLTKRINILIGPNNAGKSNVIHALAKLSEKKHDWHNGGELELHNRDKSKKASLLVEGEFYSQDARFNEFLGEIWTFSENAMTSLKWKTSFKLDDRHKNSRMVDLILGRHLAYYAGDDEWQKAFSQVADHQVSTWIHQLPQVIVVPAFRRITDGSHDVSGCGVVDLLAAWKSPEIGNDADEKKFEKIQEFLRLLIGLPDAHIQIPPRKLEIIIQANGLRFPLSSYGTGLHQLIILAITVLNESKSIICLEEPEVYLHPRLQKSMLNFLLDKTDNQYIIATHSPAFLSRPAECNIIRLWSESGVTKSEPVATSEQSLRILRDLGISASDIFQSRFLIWVEGPSDAIYLRRWLDLAMEQGLVDLPLQEGIDYSIMFYGGRLLSHLSMDDSVSKEDSIDHLINLLPINRNAAVIIDSDRANSRNEINSTKQRIQTECKNAGSFCWITAGREIENYLSPASVTKAFAEAKFELSNLRIRRYDKLDESISTAEGKSIEARRIARYSDSKVEWSRRIAPHVDTLDVLNLREQIELLAKAISKAHV